MGSLVTATPEEVGLSTEGLARVNAVVQAEIDAGTLAGAVTLVARHGQVCQVQAMGAQNIAAGQESRVDGIYRIFSMTKPVTAVAMMILWDQGLWSPEDPIAKHLPEFADAQVLDHLAPDGATRLQPAAPAPTLLHLLTHTAGLGYGSVLSDLSDPINRAYQDAQVWDAPDLAQMMARLGRLPLAFQPGTSWRYSLGMEVQGALIERLTGQSLPDFMQSNIFGPLGMIDTAFHTPPEKADRLAALYFKGGEAALTAIANPMRPDCDAPPKLAMGGGGLVSTIGDYARFAQMLLNRGQLNGQRIISAEAAALMMTNHLPDALMARGFVAGHQRIRPGFGFGFNGVVFTDPSAAGVPVGPGTYHWDGAAGTWFWVDPANDLLFVGMTQCLSYAAPPLQARTQTLMAEAILA
uniref:Beta-lactamase n=1 Tax=Caulobacter sp. (strain K31) TaxID=366602 RepID=B0T914_CAUSK